jgi:Cys-rich protein (TIGR01571 family)
MAHAASLAWGASAAEYTTGCCDCFDNCGICVSARGRAPRERHPSSAAQRPPSAHPRRAQCKGFWCPCKLYEDIREHTTGTREGCGLYCCLCVFVPTWLIPGLPPPTCCLGMANHNRLRKMYGLRGGSCTKHWCCHSCTQCQEAREIDFRRDALATTHRAASGSPPPQQFMASQ